ncbi:hypothetical protein GH714_035720 [Hevea brasiliensis]|uniref:Glycosyltransferase family 92 protein n=1 Tax=Hevea brasiliensis TaxID=3981 RepID=A0A6A6LY75_HEVBR|nr:hypothetical protein GH714_035720 [Hevea brasiliensis]
MFVGVVMNCAAELKLFLTALLILCCIATLLQLFLLVSLSPPLIFASVSPESPPLLPPPPQPPPPPLVTQKPKLNSSLATTPPNSSASSVQQGEEVRDNGIIKRIFNPYGAAAYNFITMGTYRGGLNTFAIIGLSSKPLHLYAKPPTNASGFRNPPLPTTLPPWEIVPTRPTSGGGDKNFNITDRFEVLQEQSGKLNLTVFTSKPKYEYLYCGSSLYGGLSPQRVREWIAYHVRLFGERSHFVIHDAGGVHEEVMEVLRPWMDLGYVTLQDVREQERANGSGSDCPYSYD